MTKKNDELPAETRIKKRGTLQDLAGGTFGKWTVVKSYLPLDQKRGDSSWCKCECGQEREVQNQSLLRGSSTSCGCSRIDDLLGKRFGSYTVIQNTMPPEHGKNRRKSLRCLCRCDCGTTKSVIRGDLVRGESTNCGCKRRVPEEVMAIQNIFYRYKKCAADRGLVFDLSQDDISNLIKQNCYYCGRPPFAISRYHQHEKGVAYTGIDRFDNTKGYLKENVVSCCKDCNRAKRNHSVKDFFDLVKMIYENHIEEIKQE